MNKKTIRLNESDLKKYINKVVSEQNVQPNTNKQHGLGAILDDKKARGININMCNNLKGKNVSLFYDSAKTKLIATIQVTEAGPFKWKEYGNDNFIMVKGTNIKEIGGSTGKPIDSDSIGKYMIVLGCNQKELNLAFRTNNKPTITVYCPQLKEYLTKALNCINFKPDFTSADGAPNQTGNANLSESKKKVIRLTESDLKRFINEMISKQK